MNASRRLVAFSSLTLSSDGWRSWLARSGSGSR
jgi:hypothetical protein